MKEPKASAHSSFIAGDSARARSMMGSDMDAQLWPDFMVGQPDNPVRVVLVDDDAHIRMVMAQEIMSDPRTMVIAQAGSVKEGRKAIRQQEFDVLLLDLKLGDGEGFELLDILKANRPQAEAIVVSVLDNDEPVLKSFEKGATGYLVKDSWFGNYPQAILQVVNGGASITPSLARRLLQRFEKYVPSKEVFATDEDKQMLDRLSLREQEVLQMVANGYTSTEIGEKLEISGLTVNTHVKNIYRKLQVRSRAQAVRFASLRGLF